MRNQRIGQPALRRPYIVDPLEVLVGRIAFRRLRRLQPHFIFFAHRTRHRRGPRILQLRAGEGGRSGLGASVPFAHRAVRCDQHGETRRQHHHQSALCSAPPAPLLRHQQDRTFHGIPPPASLLERTGQRFLRGSRGTTSSRGRVLDRGRGSDRGVGRKMLRRTMARAQNRVSRPVPLKPGASLHCATPAWPSPLRFVSCTRASAKGSVASSSTGVLAASLARYSLKCASFISWPLSNTRISTVLVEKLPAGTCTSAEPIFCAFTSYSLRPSYTGPCGSGVLAQSTLRRYCIMPSGSRVPGRTRVCVASAEAGSRPVAVIL